MSDNNDPNNGSGWGISSTPYGDVRNYNPGEFGSGDNSGNSGGSGTQPSSASPYSGYVPASAVRQYAANISVSDMTPIVQNIRNHEGISHTMYADTEGNVTVGIGIFLGSIADAQKQPFTIRGSFHGHGDDITTYTGATDAQIAAAFQRVKDVAADTSYSNARKATLWASSNIMINDSTIAQTLGVHLRADRTALQNMYAGFDSFPLGAKVALHDMMYNLGTTKLQKFTNLNDAVNRRDWNTAAKESHRLGIGDTRNQDTFNQFTRAAQGK